MDKFTQYALGFGALFGAFVYASKERNTTAERQNAEELLKNNFQITGFKTLYGYLTAMKWTTDQPLEPPNIFEDLIIGEGRGRTSIRRDEVKNWLTNLTAGELLPIINRAIAYQISDNDTPDDRALVLKWISEDSGKGANFGVLVDIITATNWTTTTPTIPTPFNYPLYLELRYNNRTHIIPDVPYFILHSTSDDMLKVYNDLLYPTDTDFTKRQEVFLIISEDITTPNITVFANLLSASGFISSPNPHTIPPALPNSLTLGNDTYTKAQLIDMLEHSTADSIYKFYSSAVDGYDPTLQARITAMATFKALMNNPTYYGVKDCNLPTVYGYLIQSGFLTSPRTFKPIPTLPYNYNMTVKGYGWQDIENVNKWLENATSGTVNALIQFTAGRGNNAVNIGFVKYAIMNAIKAGVLQGNTANPNQPKPYIAVAWGTNDGAPLEDALKDYEDKGYYYEPMKPYTGNLPLSKRGYLLFNVLDANNPTPTDTYFFTLTDIANNSMLLINAFIGDKNGVLNPNAPKDIYSPPAYEFLNKIASNTRNNPPMPIYS